MSGDDDAVEFDPPDPDRVYRNHVEDCRRLGIEPVPQDRAHGLMAEWSDAMASGQSNPPITH